MEQVDLIHARPPESRSFNSQSVMATFALVQEILHFLSETLDVDADWLSEMIGIL